MPSRRGTVRIGFTESNARLDPVTHRQVQNATCLPPMLFSTPIRHHGTQNGFHEWPNEPRRRTYGTTLAMDVFPLVPVLQNETDVVNLPVDLAKDVPGLGLHEKGGIHVSGW